MSAAPNVAATLLDALILVTLVVVLALSMVGLVHLVGALL